MYKIFFLTTILLLLTSSFIGIALIEEHDRNTTEISKIYSKTNKKSIEKSVREIFDIIELTRLQENKADYTKNTDKFIVLNLINIGYKNTDVLKKNLFFISKQLKQEITLSRRLFYLDLLFLSLLGIIIYLTFFQKRKK